MPTPTWDQPTAMPHSAQFLEAILDNLPLMVFVKEARDLRFVRLNPAGERFTGLDRHAVVGKTDLDLFPTDMAESFRAEDRRTLEGRRVVDIPEEPIDTPTGRRWLHTLKVPIMGPDGSPSHLLGISLDITQARRDAIAARSAREAAEASNRELESFAYSVSHDLRAPLRAIDGFSQALLEDELDQLSDRGKDYLQRVRAATQRMAGLIDHLLELSRVGGVGLHHERVDLGATSQALIDEHRAAQPNRVVSTVIEGELEVDGDPMLLAMMMRNLIGNAWKYTAKRSHAHIEVRGVREGADTVVTVRDDGAGFDPALAARLFAPFHRLHAAADFPGDGVGLATVRRIAHRHGGRVSGQGSPGAGATFTVILPSRHESP